tara:strand:- start:4729 stop:6153 length:1425 start_codon:yes stop_codon:yes gene_type:complete
LLNKQLLEKPDYWNILRSDEMTKYIDKFEDEITSKQIEPKEEYISCKICGLNVISKRYHLGNWVYVKDEHEVDPNITLGDTLPLYDQIITAGELKDWETPEFMNQIENGDFKTESIQAEGSFGKLVLKSCLSKGKFPKLHRGKIKGKNKIIESFNPLPLKESTPDSWYKKSKPIEVLSLGGGMDSCTEVIRNGDFYDIIIMSDTGAEEYETHAYLSKWFFPKLSKSVRSKTVILDPMLGGIDYYSYMERVNPMPESNSRWCTEKFKIRPINQYLRRIYGTHAVFNIALGINYDEVHRARALPTDEQLDNLIERFDLDIPRLAKRSNDTIQDYREKMKNMVQSGSQRNPEEITVWKGSEKQTGLQYVRTWYPLIENKITVDEETKILNEKGFEIPPKSGCYLCPLKSNVKFKQLEVKHPELYENAKMIDMNSKSKRKAKNWNDIESLDPNMGENPLLVKCACSDGDLSQLEDDEE